MRSSPASPSVAAPTPPPRCACSSASGSSAAKTWFTGPGRRSRALPGAQQLLELAVLEHLGDDVAAADQLPADEQLRDGRPLGPLREHDADAGVDQDVPGPVVHVHV